LYHNAPEWADRRHLLALQSQLWKKFAGSGSPFLQGRGPYFLLEACEASSELCYQAWWNFFPLTLCLVHLLSLLYILLLLLLKVPNVSFLASFVVISPLIFSSPISSSFTALLCCRLHFLCPSSPFLSSLLFFSSCPHFHPFSSGVYPLKRELCWSSEIL